MTISDWVQAIGLAWGVITTGIAVILYFKKRKTGQTSQALETALSVSQSMYDISQNIPKYITDAENIFKGDKLGLARLNYVLQQIKVDCIENNVEYNEEEYKNKIETILSTPHKKEG